jgi:hypothetical protein
MIMGMLALIIRPIMLVVILLNVVMLNTFSAES